MWRPLPPPIYMTLRISLATANYFGIGVEDLKSSSRHLNVTVPRMMAVMLVRERTKRTFPQIGQYFNRDHTTCIHAFYAMKERIAENADLRQHYNLISGLIDGTIDFAKASLPALCQRHVLQQQPVNGEGEVPDFGVSGLEANGWPHAELAAASEADGAG